MDDGHTFDAFMSYNHKADRQLAPALQRLIRRVGRPWFARATLRICRDETNLPMSEDLWQAIVTSLDASRYFILLASPDSAKSTWVAREVEYWRTHRERSTFFIVHTAGKIVWNDETTDFDWKRTDALPETLTGWFDGEPKWVTVLSSAGEAANRRRRNERLRDVARTIAAPLHGVDKDQLDGEDRRELRRARRTGVAGVIALVVLTVAAVVAANLAFSQSREASSQAQASRSRQLAAIADNQLSTNLDLANLLAVQAFRTSPNPQTRAALLRAVTANGQLVRYLPFGATVAALTASADGGTVIAGLADGRVMRWRLAEPAPEELFRLGSPVISIAVNADGSLVAGADKTSARLARPAQPPTDLPVDDGSTVAAVAMSASGRTAVISAKEDRYQGHATATVVNLAAGGQPPARHQLDSFGLPADQVAVSDEEVLLLDGGDGTWERRRLAGWALLAGANSGFGTANYGVAVSADGTAFSYTNGAGSVPIWRTDRTTDLENPPRTAETTLAALPQALALSGDAGMLAVAEGGTIHVSAVHDRGAAQQETAQLVGGGTVTSDGLRFLGSGGRRLISASGNRITLWDLDQADRIGRRIQIPVGAGCEACPPPYVAVSPDGSQFAAVDGAGWSGAVGPLDQPDHIIRLPDALRSPYTAPVWDTNSRRVSVLVQPSPGGSTAAAPAGMPDLARALVAGLRAGGVAAAGLTSDGKQLVVVENDGGLDLLDPTTGNTRTLIPDPTTPPGPKAPNIRAAAISSTADLVALADNESIVVRDAHTGAEIGRAPQTDVDALTFIPGHLLVQRSSVGLAVWDDHMHALDHIIAGDQLWPPAATPDGALLARAGTDGSVAIVDQESGSTLATLPPVRPGAKVGIGFASNGSRLKVVPQ